MCYCIVKVSVNTNYTFSDKERGRDGGGEGKFRHGVLRVMKICKQHREGRRGGGGGESQANNIEHKYYNLGFDREYIMKLNANIKLKL